MREDPPRHRNRRAGAMWRAGWTLAVILVVEVLVCGLAVLPVLIALGRLGAWEPSRGAWPIVFACLLVPSYVAFALCLMPLSALANRLTGARTPAHAEMRIADMDWPLMQWVRYMVACHVVRVLAGPLFRGSPIWTAYLRLNGARFGRRVYVNSLFISDHNLLEFGDDVVVGSEAHISGHVVEAGIVKTGGVRLGPNVTIGLGAVVDIDVVVGADSQVGALSLVPKHTTLDGGAVYAGIPARRLQ